jgi:SH3-like domain-containing protein
LGAGRGATGFLGLALLAIAATIPAARTPVFAASTAAETEAGTALGKSGLPVPRFVSLKAGRVNVRVGPGEDYKVAWIFTRPALPVEIIQEFDTWRRIRDSDGSVGWVFHSLLSGKRTVVVAPWVHGDPFPIRASATTAAPVTAYLEPGVMASVDRCKGGWCRLSGDAFSGWIEQDRLWGVYPGEEVN